MIYATAVTLPDGSQLSYVERGERHDVDDPIVKLAPEMFRHVDGRPLAA